MLRRQTLLQPFETLGVENLLIQSFYKSSPLNCSYSEKHQILPIRPKSPNILGDIECMEIWYISLHKEKYSFLIFCVKCHDLTLNLSDRLQLIHNWQHDNDMKFFNTKFRFWKEPSYWYLHVFSVLYEMI